RRAAVAHLRRADRLLPTADALQPVAVVRIGRIDVHRLFAERLLQDRVRQAADSAAADEDDPVRAFEDTIRADLFAVRAFVELVVDHLDARSVNEPQAAVALLRRDDLRRAA